MPNYNGQYLRKSGSVPQIQPQQYGMREQYFINSERKSETGVQHLDSREDAEVYGDRLNSNIHEIELAGVPEEGSGSNTHRVPPIS